MASNSLPLPSHKLTSRGQVASLLITEFQKLAVSLSAASSSDDMIPGPFPENLAVAYCCQAFNDALKAAMERREPAYTKACKAYRLAMPPLSGPENIRDFIACVAHGMLINAIDIKEGTKYLYAAQVAGGVAAKPAPAKSGRPASINAQQAEVQRPSISPE
jgi:hypothetical protein